MNSLKNKADINIDSADYLHTRSSYPAVAHCSYYSCFQLVRSIWLVSLNKTEDQLRQIIESTKKNGSHQVLINLISDYIKSNNHDDWRVINSYIGQLKRLRVSADYENTDFTHELSAKSIELAKKIRPILKKY
jgi:uncharacterized protein (UPF0332 family)